MKPEEIMREYELCRNQTEMYQQNLELIDNNLMELRAADNALEEIKGAEKGSEVLIPVGMDLFIKAKITDPGNVIAGIGAALAAKKTVDDAKEGIESRIAELEKAKADQTSNLEQTISKLRELEPSVQSIISQATKKEG